MHPWYTEGIQVSSLHDDIGVMGLEKCIIDTVPVTLSQSDDLTCEAGEMVGYGQTKDQGDFYGPSHKRTGTNGATTIARKTMLRIHSGKTCDQIHNHIYQQMYASTNHDEVDFFMKNVHPEMYVDGLSGVERERLKSDMLRRIDQMINYFSNDFCATPTTESFQMIDEGDSGGPIFVNGKQVGVASSLLLISRGYLGKYGMVSSHLGWIKRTVSTLNDCGESLPTPKRRLSLPRMPRRKLITTKRIQQDLLQLTKGKVWSIIDLMYEKDQCPVREAARA